MTLQPEEIWTTGVCITFKEDKWKDHRLFFFEIDGAMSEVAQDLETVLTQYLQNEMDLFVHRTHGGFHFLSPTIITREKWKRMHEMLHHLNPKCPMTTLRWLPNKYPNETQVWFTGKAHYNDTTFMNNSIEMCNLLNKSFGTKFRGELTATPKQVRYKIK